MVNNGTRPTELDPRDYSFARTFGAINKDLLKNLPASYNVDAGLTVPDQNADFNPYSCTAYGVCDLGQNQDGVIYEPKYTYMKTLFTQGLPPETNGSDLRPALKTAKTYGLLPKADAPVALLDKDEDFTANQGNWPTVVDTIAGKLEHRKGNYFNVYVDSGHDWFDSMRSTLWIQKGDKRATLLGTPWLWMSAPQGILSENFSYDGNPYHYSWHAWVICGWKVIGNETYLIGRPWAGKNYGDGGFVYVSRKCINRVMEIRGAVAFTLADAQKEDIESIKLDMWELIWYYLGLIGKKRLA